MEREAVTVIIVGQEVTIPLADAVVEYFRLNSANERSAHEDSVFVALTIALGTLNSGPGAEKLYEVLKAEEKQPTQ